MKVTINIDQEVLDEAFEERESLYRRTPRSESCPIALDLMRQGMCHPRVTRSCARFIDRRGVKRRFENSPEANAFVVRADLRTERWCEPTTFDLGREMPR